MGYDCTLHVIDPASVARFVELLLDPKSKAKAPAFFKAYDAPALFDEVRRRIAEEPRAGGRALLVALLQFCATETPHVPSRGFCVGLWDRLELGMGDDVPAETVDSCAVEALLAPVVAKYPALKGMLYTGIEGNYCVGHYVAPERVGSLRAHVEGVLDGLPDSMQRGPEALLRVLRVAEERGLAYWEATDIAVVSSQAAWLKPKRVAKPKPPEGVKVVAIPKGDLHRLVYEADGVGVLSSIGARETVVLDARGDEPKLTRIAGVSLDSVARTSEGRLLGTGMRLGPSGGKHEFFEIDLAAGTIRTIANPPGWDGAPSLVRRLGERVLAVARGSKATPLWLDTMESVAIPEGPYNGSWGHCDAFLLGEGTVLYVAGNTPFFVRGGEVTPAASLGTVVTYALGDVPQGVITDEGALLFAAGEDRTRIENGMRVKYSGEESATLQLCTVDTKGVRTKVFPALERAYPARPAPGGAVVVMQSDSPEKDLAKVYWHRAREVASIPRTWAGEKGHCFEAVYSAALDELWVTYGHSVVRIPWRDVEKLPRQTVEEYTRGRRDAELEAKRKAHEKTWKAVREAKSAYKWDDAEMYLFPETIIEHPEFGRGLVRDYFRKEPRYEAVFEDGTVRTFDRVAKTLVK